MEGAYNGSDGHVNRPASIERKRINKESILVHIQTQNHYGVTWKEVSEKFGYHHGQSSSALTNFHKLHKVFALRTKRDGCHVYVHSGFRPYYSDIDCFDEPVRTRSGKTNEAIAHLVQTLDDFLKFDESPQMLETAWGNWWLLELADAMDKYKIAIGELPTGTANVLSK